MRRGLLAVTSVLVALVLAGSAAYGSGRFGSAAASSPASPQGQEATDDGAEVAHAWLGIAGVSNNDELAARLRSLTSQSVVITKVIGEPAEAAGLQRGDIITALDGAEIANLGALREALAARSPGDVVTITYIREGTAQTTQATLGEQPQRLGHDIRPEVRSLPELAGMVMRLLGGQPLERLISSTVVFEGEDGAELTVQTTAGTVTATQPVTETEPSALTVQPKDGSAEQTITLEERVLLLNRLRAVDLWQAQVGDQVIVVHVLKDGELQQTMVLVGAVTFGPESGAWGARTRNGRPHLLQGPGKPGLSLWRFQMAPGHAKGLERLGERMGGREKLQGMLSDGMQQFQQEKKKTLEARRVTGGVSF